jgi:hypothetical protein
MELNDVVEREFLSECDDDYVGLWSLIWSIKNAGTTSTDVRNTTVSILQHLLAAGLIIAGEPTEVGDFEAWPGGTVEIIRRIETAWDQLGREPDIGDIVWFTAPPVGSLQLRRSGPVDG